MNKGVQILLDRMDSNPDEFEQDPLLGRKWRDIIEKVFQRVLAINGDPDVEVYYKHQLEFLSDEEVLAVYAKFKSIRADEFTRDVMARLLADADDQSYDSSQEELNLSRQNLADAFKNMNGKFPANTTPSKLHISPTQLEAAKLLMETEKLKAEANAKYNNSVARVFGKGK
jgi:hypothetical protein